MTVLVYIGFRSMLTEERSAAEYLSEVRYGGWSRQWPAAYELSRLMENPQVRADRSLVPDLVKAFDEAKEGDPRIRRYLALAIGRLEPPLPKEAIDVLTKALDEPGTAWSPDIVSRINGWSEIDINEARIMTIWALGSSGDASVVARLVPLYDSTDAGVRKIVVYASALPGEALPTLARALKDDAADVRWNAAVALARHDSAEGVPVLREMLDRTFVEQTVKRDVRQYEDQDPVADVMISGLRAAAALNDPALKASVEGLSQQDRSLRVRQAALEALKTMG